MTLWVEGKSFSKKATPSPQPLFRNSFPSISTRFLVAVIIMKTERLLLIFILSVKILLVLGVFFFFFESRFMWADTEHYASLGRNLVRGNGLSFPLDNAPGYEPTTEFMPVYPALLGVASLIQHGFIAVSILQAILAGVTALYVYRIALFFLPSMWAIGTVLICSFEPLVAAMHLLLMPETIYVCFATMFLYYTLAYARDNRPADMHAAVFTLALAIYTKPIAMYLTVFAALFLFATKGGFRKTVVFISILTLLLFPWMVRNYVLAATYAINTNGERNFCNWGLSSILAVRYGVDSSNWNTTVHMPEYEEVKGRCASVGRALWIFSTEYPSSFIKVSALSTLSLLTNDGYTVFFEKPEDEQVKAHHNYITPAVFSNKDWRIKISAALREFSFIELGIIFAGKLFWVLASLGAGAGAFMLIRKKETRPYALFLFCIVFYYVAASVLSTGLSVGARLRYPIDALLLIFATYAMRYIITSGFSTEQD